MHEFFVLNLPHQAHLISLELTQFICVFLRFLKFDLPPPGLSHYNLPEIFIFFFILPHRGLFNYTFYMYADLLDLILYLFCIYVFVRLMIQHFNDPHKIFFKRLFSCDFEVFRNFRVLSYFSSFYLDLMLTIAYLLKAAYL